VFRQVLDSVYGVKAGTRGGREAGKTTK
jgi:hypothetical protein